MTHEPHYIWQHPSWPDFRWDGKALIKALGECRFQQGSLLTQMRELGMEVRQQARAEVLIEEALKTSAIEGETLDPKAVRSSVARRLDLPTAGLPDIRDRHADGVVAILLEATRNHDSPLTAERLFSWHAALFPTGYSGLRKIRAAAWRDDRDGPMQVVSGPVSREKVHYEAPPAKQVPHEMKRFLRWWEVSRRKEDGLLRAAIAHLWFVAIHPFDDGNGRIARTLTEMALAQDEALATRYYSLSSQIMADSASYYAVLECINKGNGEITEWLLWFLDCMTRAILRSNGLLNNVLAKARYWQSHFQTELNERQRKVINRLLEAGPDGFEGGMTNRQYASMTHVSRATAQRELADLVKKGILRQNQAKGRNVSYSLVWEDSVRFQEPR
ncbi:MAG: Fic family protein [Gammaproteobacteria bacterium]|nr:MAG: Fic family protein [Gammaproteobacteria bacterium]